MSCCIWFALFTRPGHSDQTVAPQVCHSVCNLNVLVFCSSQVYFSDTTDLLVVVQADEAKEMSVIDLSNPNNSCSPLPIGPIGRVYTPWTTHGTFFGGRLTVCGERASDCFQYDDVTRQWSRIPGRSQRRFIPYGLDQDGGHWVTGGEDIDSYDYPNTTEIFDGSEFRPFIEMPVGTRDHCVTRLAGSEVLVMGGM